MTFIVTINEPKQRISNSIQKMTLKNKKKPLKEYNLTNDVFKDYFKLVFKARKMLIISRVMSLIARIDNICQIYLK